MDSDEKFIDALEKIGRVLEELERKEVLGWGDRTIGEALSAIRRLSTLPGRRSDS